MSEVFQFNPRAAVSADSPRGDRMKIRSCIQRKMIVGLFVLSAVGMGHAQIGGDVLKVKIPFSFNVGTQTFSPGEYSLKPLLPHTMLLRNEAGEVLTNIGTNSIESSEVPKSTRLIFKGYGGQYFL